jgi:hypothetical protein
VTAAPHAAILAAVQTRRWTLRRDRHAPAHDDESFVGLVSDALFVPDAAPEIRMIAEVMASMSIPASHYQPADTSSARRLLGARSAVAVAVVALAGTGLAASAYAGVLPGSLQDVAHHVINAPSRHHGPGPARSPNPIGPAGGHTDGPGSGAAAPSGPAMPSGSAEPDAHPTPPRAQPVVPPDATTAPAAGPSHSHGHEHSRDSATPAAPAPSGSSSRPAPSGGPSTKGGGG